MKFVLKLLQFVYSVYALLMFVLLMILVLPFVLIASLLGQEKGGNFIYKVCMVWGYVWYTLIGMWHKTIYESPHNTNDKFIFVANHISYLDIPPVVVGIKQPVRVLGKYEMVNTPLFGYIYKCAVILVDRRDARRRSESIKHLKDALKKHISILIFPEGTFNETGEPLKSFYDGAFRIAIETQTPIKPILFIDSHDRLHYGSVVQLTPGPNRVVYLKEVEVAGLTMADVTQLREKVKAIMEAGLRRYRTYGPSVAATTAAGVA